MCTISVREDMGTGEMTHLLAYILLLQKAWALFLAPTRGDSQLPVPPAPGNLNHLLALVGTHTTNTYKQIHTLSESNKSSKKERKYVLNNLNNKVK